MNQLVTSENNERVKSFFLSLDCISLAMERLFVSKKPTLKGESFYTDEELSKKLKLSQRSLQDYRETRDVFLISSWAVKFSIGRRILKNCSKTDTVINSVNRFLPFEYSFLFSSDKPPLMEGE